MIQTLFIVGLCISAFGNALLSGMIEDQKMLNSRAVGIFLHERPVIHLQVPTEGIPSTIVRRYIADQQTECARSVILPFLRYSGGVLCAGVTSAMCAIGAGIGYFDSTEAQLQQPFRDPLDFLQIGERRVHTKKMAIKELVGASWLSGMATVYYAQKGHEAAIGPREYCNQLIQEGTVRYIAPDGRPLEIHPDATQALRSSPQYHSLAKWLYLGITRR